MSLFLMTKFRQILHTVKRLLRIGSRTKSFGQISAEQVLLRTLLEKTWVKDGKPHYTAFQPKPKDKDGLSLFFDKQEAGKRFANPIFGFLDVFVGSVRNIKNNDENLDIIQDEEFHALIIGVPNYQLMPRDTQEQKDARRIAKKQGTFLAGEIADKASDINDYVEAGFSPKDLLNL